MIWWWWWLVPIMALPQDYESLLNYAELIHAVYCQLTHGLAIDVVHWFQFSDFPRDRDLGFIGLDHTSKEVVVVMAGTGNDHDWFRNAQFISVPHELCHRCSVHRGFGRIAGSLVKEQKVIKSLMKKHPDYKLVFTGHSLGGAIVQLFALHFVEYYDQMLVVTYASPRVGNVEFANHMDQVLDTLSHCRHLIETQGLSGGHILVTHVGDIVPGLPPGYAQSGCQYHITKGPLPHPPDSLVRSDAKAETGGDEVGGQTWGRIWRQQEHKLQMAHTEYFIDILLC